MNNKAQEAASKRASRPASRWVRVVVPAFLIIIWTAVAGVGGPYFGRIGEVSSNEQAAYLPSTADATAVAKKLEGFRSEGVIPAVAVFTVSEGTIETVLPAIQDALSSLGTGEGLAEPASPALPSTDGVAAEAFLVLDSTGNVGESVATLRTALEDSVPDTVAVQIAGPAAFSADLLAAFSGIDGLLLAVALVAVLIILVAVYRSVLLPVAVLATSMFALASALLVLWWLAKAGVVLLSGQTQGILFILVIGAATDYSLLYVARYRESLRINSDSMTATRQAIKRSAPAILASGSTVIAGLMMLLLSDLKSNSSLGPVASVGILFAMASALTLLPSIMLLTGRKIFWPRVPHYEPEVVAASNGMPTKGVWPRIAPLIAKHPRTIWVSTAGLLVVGAAFAPALEASGVSQSDLVLGTSSARDAQEILGEHFPGGSGSPAYVLVPEDQLQEAADILLENEGVASVSVLSQDSPAGSVSVTQEGLTAFGPPGTEPSAPTVVEGDIVLQATLASPADSPAAEQTVKEVRVELDETLGDALVGGVTATAIDTNDASIRDRNLIIPLVLLVILLILMVLLRAVLAPILLIATTVLSYGTALGVAAIVFNHVLKLPGADPAVPLYGFVFLVALGIDYNIFLMTRVREESLTHGTRQGVLRGLGITGGVITSAGLVLAATFAALSVIPILFLLQIAFIVSFGVLLDTFLVRSLLVPALSYDIGRAIWWPSSLARGKA